jgi:ribosome-associated protein
MLMVKIDTEYITLGQLLKMTNIISSGAEAKTAVKEMMIFVNGQKEDRRGRKLYPGDVIDVDKKIFKVEK